VDIERLFMGGPEISGMAFIVIKKYSNPESGFPRMKTKKRRGPGGLRAAAKERRVMLWLVN
jgi:hypothetical protein